jgi:hypothetical protein
VDRSVACPRCLDILLIREWQDGKAIIQVLPERRCSFADWHIPHGLFQFLRLDLAQIHLVVILNRFIIIGGDELLRRLRSVTDEYESNGGG